MSRSTHSRVLFRRREVEQSLFVFLGTTKRAVLLTCALEACDGAVREEGLNVVTNVGDYSREFPRLDEPFEAAQGLFRLKPDSLCDRGTKFLASHLLRVHLELEAV